MATIDEIAKDLENLKKKLEEDVERLQEDIKSRKEEILNLEKALSEIVETKQLRVTDNAQIAGRNVIADGQVLDNHENRLNNHDSTFDAHTQTLNNHEQILNSHTQTLNNQAQLLTNHQQQLNEHGQILGNRIFFTTVEPGTGENAKKNWWESQNYAHRYCRNIGYETGFMIGESADGVNYPIACLK
jgi:DNA repair exonuclease SbcCD ATPase subunit